VRTEPYELGVSTSLFAWDVQPPMPFPESVAILAEFGIHHVELWCNESPAHLDCGDQAQLAAARDALRHHDVRLHSAHIRHHPAERYGLALLDKTARGWAVDEATRQIEAMVYLGGEVAVLHPGSFPRSDVKARIEACCDAMAKILARFDGAPVRFALENQNRGEFCHDPDELLALVSAINSPRVGVCLDTSHANLYGNVLDFVRKCGEQIFAWHISDNDGRSDQHRVPFKGTIPWPAVMDAAEACGYRGVLMVELAGAMEPRKILSELVRVKTDLNCA